MKIVRAAVVALCLLLLFCVGLDLAGTFDGSFYFVFQSRDIARARALLAGQPVFFGPEMTGGGNLPGPLYYVLLALFLGVNPGWLSTWFGMIALAGAGGVAGWAWVRARFSAPSAWLWLALYSTGYFTQVLLELFLNISYILPFAVGALIFICEAASAEGERARERAFLLACLFVGLAIQLHFSLIFFLFALFALRPVRGAVLLKGAGVFFLTWIPYLAWLAGLLGGQWTGMVGRSREALPTIVSYVANVAQISPADTLAHTGRFLEVLPLPLLLLWGALAAARAPAAAGREEKVARALRFCVLFGLVPFAYFFVAPIGRRYVVPLGLPLLFYAPLLFERCRRSPLAWRWFQRASVALAPPALLGLFFSRSLVITVPMVLLHSALAAAAFGCAALFFSGPRWRLAVPLAVVLAAATGLTLAQRAYIKRGATNSSHVNGNRYVASTREWRAIWTVIRSRTCWSYEEARKRVFFVNHHLEQEPEFTWELAKPQACGTAMGEGPEPDGFFVSILKRDREPITPWLLRQNIQSDLKRGLSSGAIQVLEPSLSRAFLVVPYRVLDRENYPAHFHNSGAGYLVAGRNAPFSPAAAPEKATMLPDGGLEFRWNQCAGLHPFCDSGATVYLEREGAKRWAARVEVRGPVISQSSPWISPNWTESWRRPYVEVSCGKATTRKQLADSIGYEQAYGHRPGFPFDYNNSFVAPFERRFTFECREKPRRVSVGREGTAVESLRAVSILPERKLTLELSP